MLRLHHLERGVTLVELMVTLALFAFMMLMAAPGIGSWIQNGRIRTSAESILNGLQMAKGEAVARNARVRFQLTSTANGDCIVSDTGQNWVVNIDPTAEETAVNGHCGDAPDDTVAPRLLQVRSAADGSTGTEVQASAATVVFNGLGRPTPTPGGDITMDISYPAGGACAVDGGPMACLRVVVSTQGLIRMCNPKLTSTNPSDARAC